MIIGDGYDEWYKKAREGIRYWVNKEDSEDHNRKEEEVEMGCCEGKSAEERRKRHRGWGGIRCEHCNPESAEEREYEESQKRYQEKKERDRLETLDWHNETIWAKENKPFRELKERVNNIEELLTKIYDKVNK